MMRPASLTVLAVFAVGSLGAPRPVATQGLPTAVGAVAGAGTGVWLSVAYITAQARMWPKASP